MEEFVDPKHVVQSPHREAYEEFLQIKTSPKRSKGLYKYLSDLFPVEYETPIPLSLNMRISGRKARPLSSIQPTEDAAVIALHEIRHPVAGQVIVPAGAIIDQAAYQTIEDINRTKSPIKSVSIVNFENLEEEPIRQDLFNFFQKMPPSPFEPEKLIATRKYTLKLAGFRVIPPLNTPADYALKGRSYEYVVKLDFQLVTESSVHYDKKTILQKPATVTRDYPNITFSGFPAFTDRGTFIIDGHERVPLIQLIPRAGLYFEDNEKEEVLQALVRPERGKFLRIFLDKRKGRAKVDLNNERFGLTEFLKELGIYDEVAYLFKKITKNAWPDDEDLKRHGPMAFQDFSYYYSHLFEGKENFDLGDLGRESINRRLNPAWGKAVKSATHRSHCLSPADIAGILAYLIALKDQAQTPGIKTAYFTDDLLDLRNRQALLLSHQIERDLSPILGKFRHFLEDRLEAFHQIKYFNLDFSQTARNELAELFTGALCPLSNPTNPLSEVSLKREVTMTGPGGIQSMEGNFSRRGVHPSHYGRLCLTETPESEKIGFILHLALAARVDKETRQIEAPYHENSHTVWLKPAEEEDHTFAPKQGNPPHPPQVRDSRSNLIDEVADYTDFYHGQFLGLAAQLIPFIQHDDNNRAMMGAKNMKQAVPLLFPEPPLIATGREELVARLSGRAVYAPGDGYITSISAHDDQYKTEDQARANGKTAFSKGWGDAISVDSRAIRFHSKKTGDMSFPLDPIQGTMMKTVTWQRPAQKTIGKVEKDRVLLDGSGIRDGKLALGVNLLTAYMPYYGYNFEDGIVISDRLVREDVLTSLHMWEVEMEVHGREAMCLEDEGWKLDGKGLSLGIVSMTRGEKATKKVVSANLTDRAFREKKFNDFKDFVISKGLLCREGQEVRKGDILFKKYDVADRKQVLEFRAPVPGTLVKIEKIFVAPAASTEAAGSVKYKMVAHILEERKIKVGDKLMGRHGNKGVVARIVPQHEMPYLEDGTTVDILLNPHGVISRMNLGQILETHWGWVISHDEEYRKKYGVIHPFEKVPEKDLQAAFNKLKATGMDIDEQGKVNLINGRTGKRFDSRVVVGYQYLMKLNHLVEDKIMARETGPYSLITQQPTKGKRFEGGQRVGEMEVWALESHLARKLLREFLTLKSDEVSLREISRSLVEETLQKADQTAGKHLFPESLRSAVMLLRGLALDLSFLDESEKEIPVHYRLPEALKKMKKIPALLTPHKARIRVAPPELIENWANSKEVTSAKRPRAFDSTIRWEIGSLYDPDIFEDKKNRHAWREKMGCIRLARPILHPLYLNLIRKECREVLDEKLGDLINFRKVRIIWSRSDGKKAIIRDIDVSWSELELLPLYFKAFACGCEKPEPRDSGKICPNCGKTADREMEFPTKALGGVELLLLKIQSKVRKRELELEKLKSSSDPGMVKIVAIAQKEDMLRRTKDFEEKLNKLILHVLPVLPLAYRPVRAHYGKVDIQSDLNEFYRDILSRNEKIKKMGSFDQPIARTLLNEQFQLQWTVNRLMVGDARSNREGETSLAKMIKGKEGILRMFLLGKRVDASARSVIIPDPALKPWQFGLPLPMALDLCRSRITRRLADIEKGGDFKADEILRDREKAENHLKLWSLVEDELKGLVFILNRAPSLHKYNLLAFEAVLTDNLAIGLHPLVCKGFNADFDGDTMSVLLPLSEEAQKEARARMMFSDNFISSRNGDLMFHFDQDIPLGIYLMTSDPKGLTEFKSWFAGTSLGRGITGAVTAKKLEELVSKFYEEKKNKKETLELSQRIMEAGFKWATEHGLTFSIFDVPYVDEMTRSKLITGVKEEDWKKKVYEAVEQKMN